MPQSHRGRDGPVRATSTARASWAGARRCRPTPRARAPGPARDVTPRVGLRHRRGGRGPDDAGQPGRPSSAGRSCRACCGAARRDLDVTLFGRELPTPLLLAPIGAAALAQRGQRPAWPRGPQRLARHAVRHLEPGLQPDGGRGGSDGHGAPLVPALLEHRRAAGRQHDPPGRGDRLRGPGRHRRHDDARLAAPGPQPREPAVRAGHRHRAVHLRPPLPAGRGRAPRGPRGAAPRDRVTPTAVRSLLSITREHPGGFRDNLRSPVPRAAVEAFLDIYSNPGLGWDHLATLRERTASRSWSRGSCTRTTPGGRSSSAPAASSSRTTAGGRSTAPSPRSTPCRPSARRWARRPCSSSTAGCARGPTCFKALALGADAVGVGRPWVYGLALAGEPGCATCSPTSWPSST